MRLTKHRGKWAVRIEDGRKFSTGLDATAENRALAERKASEVVASLIHASEQSTVDEVMRLYLADKKHAVVDPERIENAWKALRPMFADMAPERISRDVCRVYHRKRLGDGVQPGTINKELGVLRAALRHASPQTPAVIELLPAPAPRDRWLSREEFSKLLHAAAKTPHLTLFLHLAIATAARKEAILDLRWNKAAVGPGYVDLEAGIINMGVKHNGKKRAVVPMNRTVAAVLQEAKRCAVTDHVIEYGAARVGNIKNAFGKAVKRAGLIDVTIHDLRHTAAVWMAGAGVPMSKISQYLGHSDTATTERIYARYQPEHLKDAASALEFKLP